MTNVMYIGPTMRGIVRRNQIYTYTPTEVIEKATEVSELAKYFFIGMDDIVSAKNELKRENSFLDIAYKKVTKEVLKWLTSTT